MIWVFATSEVAAGFQAYHIRAVAEELEKERGVRAQGSDKHEPWAKGLEMHTKPWVRARATREHWSNIRPSSGRPFSGSMSQPDAWGVTAGDEALKQQAERVGMGRDEAMKSAQA